jgi:hypothetical protein
MLFWKAQREGPLIAANRVCPELRYVRFYDDFPFDQHLVGPGVLFTTRYVPFNGTGCTMHSDDHPAMVFDPTLGSAIVADMVAAAGSLATPRVASTSDASGLAALSALQDPNGSPATSTSGAA